MEVSLELILGVGGLIVGVLGLLGKRKYAKIGEAIIRGVNSYVKSPPVDKMDDMYHKAHRKKVKEHIRTISELMGVDKKLDQFKCRVEKNANRVIEKYFENDR